MAISISYSNIGDTTPTNMASMEMPVGEFVQDIMGVANLSKVKVLLNGSVVTDFDQELEDGDSIKVETLKTDSGK